MIQVEILKLEVTIKFGEFLEYIRAICWYVIVLLETEIICIFPIWKHFFYCKLIRISFWDLNIFILFINLQIWIKFFKQFLVGLPVNFKVRVNEGFHDIYNIMLCKPKYFIIPIVYLSRESQMLKCHTSHCFWQLLELMNYFDFHSFHEKL